MGYGNEDYTTLGQLKMAGSLDAEEEKTENQEPTVWRLGDLCVAMWNEDMVWYHGEILEFVGDRVKVRFVEYGNEDYTTIGQLKMAGSLDAEVEKEEVKKEEVTEKKEWKIGDLCVAQWREDGVWYDSEILEIVGERVKVKFVEYGNEDYTTLGQLKMAGSLDAEEEKTENQEPKVWRVGDLCVAMWNEDMVWYNSEILEFVGDRVKVRFVEYGNEDYTTIGQLKMAGSLDAEVEKEEVKKEEVTEKKEWKIGDLCVAQWREDGVWYDSEILEIVGERVKVKFVEYGNEDYTTLGQLKMAGSLDAEE